MKTFHEIRDPIHTFIRLHSDERRVLDSRPVQRLRHIHQLAMTFLVYPGASHKRFEHSLGVMELATRIFDTITERKNIQHDSIRRIVPSDEEYGSCAWRPSVTTSATCRSRTRQRTSSCRTDGITSDSPPS
ncbi:MAG: hypothetical protein PVG07_05830 [Acidobacteriota bacterium]|jgi:HD superfamily phosphohydrolase